VRVGIGPYTAETAQLVSDAVAPHAVVVEHSGRPRHLVGEAGEAPAR
jgi:hypothetical protein